MNSTLENMVERNRKEKKRKDAEANGCSTRKELAASLADFVDTQWLRCKCKEPKRARFNELCPTIRHWKKKV